MNCPCPGCQSGYLENLLAGRASCAGARQRRDRAGDCYAIDGRSRLRVRSIYEDHPASVSRNSRNRESALLVRDGFEAVWITAIDYGRAFHRRAALLDSHNAGERDERLTLAQQLVLSEPYANDPLLRDGDRALGCDAWHWPNEKKAE